MMPAVSRGAALLLLLFFLFWSGGCGLTLQEPASKEADVLLDRAVQFLWKQQDQAGGWHSKTHTLLRSGQALTPFILATLLEASPEAFEAEGTARGVAFIRQHVDEHGMLGRSDPLILEYPNYATAYALRVLALYNDPGDEARVKQLQAYLLKQQFDGARGVLPNEPAYGGWGFGETNLASGQVGHVDLSHTRRVLEALRLSGMKRYKAYEKALVFIDNIQRKAGAPDAYRDGGFYYSPVVVGANKGGLVAEPAVYNSYATATCDGLLAMLAAGRSSDAPAAQYAIQWLYKHPELDAPEGIPIDRPTQWHRVLFIYHLSVRAAVYDRIGWPDEARNEMVALLRAHVSPDGSFVNLHGAPNKENDPLVATALAIQTLRFIAKTSG